jgi:hypothetical protein
LSPWTEFKPRFSQVLRIQQQAQPGLLWLAQRRATATACDYELAIHGSRQIEGAIS